MENGKIGQEEIVNGKWKVGMSGSVSILDRSDHSLFTIYYYRPFTIYHLPFTIY